MFVGISPQGHRLSIFTREIYTVPAVFVLKLIKGGYLQVYFELVDVKSCINKCAFICRLDFICSPKGCKDVSVDLTLLVQR